ncbi:CvpA family protein [Candidatus Gottesmanbacteria bacterium]|nr:CvpA family protein [Candidatus Gottesmanbacteria bacterium]
MNFPALHGNWVDLAILIEIFFYLLGGWGRGLILGILDLGGLLLSFFASLKFYSFVGELLVVNFSLPRGIANASGFLISGLLSELLLSFVINLTFRKIYPLITVRVKAKKLELILSVDKILGFIPVLGEALIFTAFILTLFVTLPIQGAVKKDIVSSKIGAPLIAKTQGIERKLNAIFGAAVNETLTFLTVNPSPSSGEKVDLRFTQKESHYNPEGQSPFDRMDKAGIHFTSAGENLALAPNVELAHQGLMNSPGHRRNILSPDFGKVGIGAIDGGIYGEMFVQEFTD